MNAHLFAASALLLLLAAPAALADPDFGCVTLIVDGMGSGLGAYVATDDAVGASVTSGAPGDGVTVGFLVYPAMCETPGNLDG